MGIQVNRIRFLPKSLIIVFALFLKSIYCFGQQISSEHIKTVVLYSFGPGDAFSKRYTMPAVVNPNSGQNLYLEFDDLRASHNQFRAKIYHLNQNNENSGLAEMEYLNEFNEFFLNEFEISENTKIPYYHYTFKVPSPKISGNYRLEIFENYESEPIIAINFWVVNPKIGIDAKVRAAIDAQLWRTHQQLDMSLDISNINIAFPQNELKIKVRKNQRDDQLIVFNNNNLKASGPNKLTYRHFDNQNLFFGGNEFRFIDFSSNIRRGQNIEKIELGRPDEYTSVSQKNRGNKNYVDAYDNNGKFIIMTRDHNIPEIGADYSKIIFKLDIPYKTDGSEINIMGAFTQWTPQQLEYNPNTQTYQKEFFLKQGVYDFIFSENKQNSILQDEIIWEGNFSETKNTYEIFIYHQIPGSRNYALLGYQVINEN
jgi:hypothetical protein